MTTLIEENDVSLVTLSLALENAVIRHVTEDDKSIYITEDSLFPHWIRIFKDSGLVAFRTHTNFRATVNLKNQLETCNELNSSNYVATAYAKDNRLIFDHVLNYRDGLLLENFIRTVRHFSSNIQNGLERVDSENDFVLPPGETETEDE